MYRKSMYNHSFDIKLICKDFLKKLLISLKGDMNKLVEVVGLIFESRHENLTFSETWKLSREEPLTSAPTSYSAAASVAKPIQTFVPVTGRSSKQNSPKASAARIPDSHRASQPMNLTRIDLHGMQVNEAMEKTRKITRDWWQSEQNYRVDEGKLHNYGSTAQFMESLQVVTGRGIHSEGGVSRIKPKVRKFLTENNYTFEEETWGFIILGERRA